MDDMRHVTVECFAGVAESVPEFKEEDGVWKEVDDKATYLGKVHRYYDGVHESLVTSPRATRDRLILDVKNVPVGDIRLRKLPTYRLNCCKACRADFLGMLSQWAKGRMVDESPYCRD